jgi:NAD(P)H-dependent FMN reductase
MRTAASLLPPTVSPTIYTGMGDLPHFNPDDDTEPLAPAVVRLRSAIGAADVMLVSTPEYAGALPGSFKNVFEWAVGGMEISRKPVGWINASSSPTNAKDAHESLRKVLGYVDADIVEAACVHIPVPRDVVDPDGIITEPAIRTRIADVVGALHAHAHAHVAAGSTAPA